jgi:hypothetical protein
MKRKTGWQGKTESAVERLFCKYLGSTAVMCVAICAKSLAGGTCPKLGCGALNPACQQPGSVLTGRNLLAHESWAEVS